MTYLVMPYIYSGFQIHLPIKLAWQVTMLIPVVITSLVAFICFYYGTDKPEPQLQDQPNPDQSVRSFATGTTAPTLRNYIRGSLFSLPIAILMFQYACSFGVELAIDSVIGHYLEEQYGISPKLAATIGIPTLKRNQ